MVFALIASPWRRHSFVLAMLAAVTAASSAADPVAVPAADPSTFVDFEQLERPSSPNHWLVAPAGAVPRLNADAQAPILAVPAARLAAAWLEVVRNRPRTSIIAVSDDGFPVL